MRARAHGNQIPVDLELVTDGSSFVQSGWLPVSYVPGSSQLQGPLRLFPLPLSNSALLSREMTLFLFETTLC